MTITEHDNGDLGGGRPNTGGDGPRYPSITLNNVGDYADLVLVDRDETFPRIDPVTKAPKLKPNGKPGTVTQLTGVVMQGTAAVRVGEDQQATVTLGQAVTYYAEGHNRWDDSRDDSWSDVVEAFVAANGNVTVGDVVRVHLRELSSTASNGARLQIPKKIVAHSIRRPRPEEAGWVTLAADTRRQHLAAKAAADAAPAAPAAQAPPAAPTAPPAPPAPVAAPPAAPPPSAPPAASPAPPAAPPAPAPAAAGPPLF